MDVDNECGSGSESEKVDEGWQGVGMAGADIESDDSAADGDYSDSETSEGVDIEEVVIVRKAVGPLKTRPTTSEDATEFEEFRRWKASQSVAPTETKPAKKGQPKVKVT